MWPRVHNPLFWLRPECSPFIFGQFPDFALCIERIDKFGRLGSQESCTGFLFHTTRFFIANRVGEKQPFKTKTIKSIVSDRENCFGHDALSPIFPAKPKTSIFGSSRAPQVDNANNLAWSFFEENSQYPPIVPLSWNNLIPNKIKNTTLLDRATEPWPRADL
jgi:hypothetical protein